MPIFEYRCTNCGTSFEHFTQRAKDAQQPECPKCGGRQTERILSAFSSRASSGGGCGSAASGGG